MNKIYLMLLLAFLTWNCDSFLDVPPKGKAIPTTVEDFDKMLNNSGFSISDISFLDPDHYVPDGYANKLSPKNGRAYLWSDFIYNPTESDKNWEDLYAKLYYCNYIIKNIGEATAKNINLKDWVKGQAHAQRAHIYFWLVNLYGMHINEATMDQDLAVPKKTELPLDEKLPRATVKEIYELIESDLDIAEDLVPKRVDMELNYKATQNGIKALRAKIALFKGNFPEVLSITNDLITDIGEKFNDYNEVTEPETFLTMGEQFESYNNREIIWYSGAQHRPSEQNEQEAHFLSPELTSLYTDKENDLRYKFWMRDTTRDGSLLPAPRFVNYHTNNLTASIGEIYLIRAECYARRGNAGDEDLAMNDVNTLRKYRFKTGSSYTLSAENAAEALQKVKEERRREFVGSGLNWFDLRRYQHYGDNVPDFTRIVNGETYELKAGSNRYVLAIPEFIRDQNPLLEQNPR